MASPLLFRHFTMLETQRAFGVILSLGVIDQGGSFCTEEAHNDSVLPEGRLRIGSFHIVRWKRGSILHGSVGSNGRDLHTRRVISVRQCGIDIPSMDPRLPPVFADGRG